MEKWEFIMQFLCVQYPLCGQYILNILQQATTPLLPMASLKGLYFPCFLSETRNLQPKDAK